jgi:hypothetical protein
MRGRVADWKHGPGRFAGPQAVTVRPRKLSRCDCKICHGAIAESVTLAFAPGSVRRETKSLREAEPADPGRARRGIMPFVKKSRRLRPPTLPEQRDSAAACALPPVGRMTAPIGIDGVGVPGPRVELAPELLRRFRRIAAGWMSRVSRSGAG